MMTLSCETLEGLRRAGIDAHDAGKPRSENPYSYEASSAWDSGWLQASQAAAEANESVRLPDAKEGS